MSDWYILDSKRQPENVPLLVGAQWRESVDFEKYCRVGLTDIPEIGLSVSTVFLGLDHSYGGGPPVLFETLAHYQGEEIMDRYCSWEDAEEGHRLIVEQSLSFHELLVDQRHPQGDDCYAV